MKRARIDLLILVLVIILGLLPFDCRADDPGPFICALDDFTHSLHYKGNAYRGSGNCWYQNTPHLKFPVRVESHYLKFVDYSVLSARIWSGSQYNSQANLTYRLYADCPIDGVLYDVSCPTSPGSDASAPDYFNDLEHFLRTFFPDNFRSSWRHEYEASKQLHVKYPPLVLSPKNTSVQNNPSVEIETRLLFPAVEPYEGWNWTVVFDRWDPSQGSNGKWVSGPYSYTEFESVDELSGNYYYTRGRRQFNFNPGTYRVTARAKAKDGRTTPWSYHTTFTVGQKFVMPDEFSPMIAIQTPPENEGFYIGDKVHIRWNSLGIKDKIKIGLIRGETYRNISPVDGVENSGYWRWGKIPADIKPGQYIISIKTIDGSIRAYRPIQIKMKLSEHAKDLLKPELKKGSFKALKQQDGLMAEKHQMDIDAARGKFVALNVFEVLSPKENREYLFSVNLKVVTPKENKIHFRLAKRIGETNQWNTDWMLWVADEDELIDKGTHYLWEKNLTLEPADYYFIARPNDSRIALGHAASDSDGIQFTVKKLQVGKHVAKKKEGADVSSIGQLKKKMVTSGDKEAIKPVLLLPAVKTRSFSSGSPIALKFRHDVRQKQFKYEFEKWDEKRKRWVKTSEPRMIRSQTSKGLGMVMTTAYFRFKTPGKYRWGTGGLSSQNRQEIVVGEAAARRVAAKTTHKQVADTGKRPKLEHPSRKEKSPAKVPQSIHQIKKPSIWFDLTTKPAPTPRLNKAFNIVIGARNIGAEKNKPNKVVVKLSCQALDGGKCEKLFGDPVVPPIKPGEKKDLNWRSVFKATKGGKYRVSVVLDPVPQTPANVKIRMSNLRKSYSFDFNIIEYTFPKNETIKKQPKKIQKRVPSKVMKNE